MRNFVNLRSGGKKYPNTKISLLMTNAISKLSNPFMTIIFSTQQNSLENT